MIFSRTTSLEDLVVEYLLAHESAPANQILEHIIYLRKRTTKQALYSALRSLLASDVIAKAGKSYHINILWKQKVGNFMTVHESFDPTFGLSDKESIVYSFPNFITCDHYWAHVFYELIRSMSQSTGIFVWNYHEVFVLARKTEESIVFENLQKEGRYAFYSVGGQTAVDKKFMKEYESEYLRISLGDSERFHKNYFLNIFGDVIIEVTIASKLAEEIDALYNDASLSFKECARAVEEVLSKRSPVRMKISRNRKKAEELARKLSRDFLIPDSISLGT